MARRSQPVRQPVPSLWLDVADAWHVPELPTVREWVPANIRVPESIATDDDRFDLNSNPHAAEVLNLADDPNVREIYLRWSTRNGKTFTGLSVLFCLVATTGRPGLLASVNEGKLLDTVDSEVYPILESTTATRSMLLPEHKRSTQKGIVLGRNRVRLAWSGSPATLAGYQMVYALATEVGLWPKNMLNRFRQRARNFPFDRKLIFEGKPEDEGNCAISYLVDHPTTQRRYNHVPCPHCGTFQRLHWGDGKGDGPGITWTTPKDGRTDPLLARRTAHYRCVSGCEIHDADRAAMMRHCVWVPEGCEIDEHGTITGEPLVQSANVALDELSALYSLKIEGWGDLVTEFLEAKGDPETLREFQTGTLARLNRPKKRDVDTVSVTQRLTSEVPLRVCPEWAVFLTRAIDVQSQTEVEFPWVVCAWGPGGRGALIDYGTAYGWEQLSVVMAGQEYHHADGGIPLRPTWTGIDSGDGNLTENVYTFAGSHPRCLPVKGSSTGFPDAYRLSPIGDDKHLQRRGDTRSRALGGETLLVNVNTDRSQRWLQKHIEGHGLDKPDQFTVAADAALDQSLIEELLNEQPLRVFHKTTGQPRTVWQRIDTNAPNDARDCVRYAWTMAMFVTDNGKHWDNLPARAAGQKSTRPKQQTRKPSILTGGGRQWPK
jgi:phage terminase large subunit GpA-like protein